MTTVRAIRYTSEPAEWRRIAEALGLRPIGGEDPMWSVFVGGGELAVHAVPPGGPLDGTTELQVLVSDLADARRAVEAAGWRVRDLLLDDGTPYLRLAGDDDVLVSVVAIGEASAPPEPRPTAAPNLDVMPIWYSPELDPRRSVLEALGLRARLAADSGTWMEFDAEGGGRCALHRDERARIELSFQTVDPAGIHAALAAAGIDADIVDEAYNRTVIARTRHGVELWINGPIDDLHGYRRLDGAATRAS